MFLSLSWMILDGLKGANLAHCRQRCQMIGAGLHAVSEAMLSCGITSDTIQNSALDPSRADQLRSPDSLVSRIVHSMETE
ncbi:hypothetical protein [Pseudoxanthomonas sp. z9]|uniref:hypothetical protein n=1 Tax=Pseudoxanthomonas sp. z9 TaxID=2584942 RepID=UPI0011416D05|nr:hypothetical protein [Pseudoxanthomonas sp. z9]